MLGKPFSGGLGDIRNFPRKNQLEEDIIKSVKNSYSKSISVRKIIIFGSYGRGTAIPFVSDLDVQLLINSINEKDKDDIFRQTRRFQLMINEERISLDKLYVLFNKADIIPYINEDRLVEAMQNSIPVESEESIAYNLTDGQTIRISRRGEIKGLNL